MQIQDENVPWEELRGLAISNNVESLSGGRLVFEGILQDMHNPWWTGVWTEIIPDISSKESVLISPYRASWQGCIWMSRLGVFAFGVTSWNDRTSINEDNLGRIHDHVLLDLVVHEVQGGLKMSFCTSSYSSMVLAHPW